MNAAKFQAYYPPRQLTMLIFFTLAIMAIVGYVYAREGVLTSICMTVSIFIAGLVAFNFYEPLATELSADNTPVQAVISEDQKNNSSLGGYEDAICLFGLFAATLGLLRVLTQNLAKTELDLPALAQQISASVFGVISGYLLAGFLVCMFQTLPLNAKFLGFDGNAGTSGLRRVVPPDRVWLAVMHRASTGPFAASPPSPFDPAGTFTLRYARLRRLKDPG